MSGLFGKASAQPMPELPKPKPVRMPVERDQSFLDSARRAREAFMRRRGRQSTILSDSLKETVGSSGQSLGG